MSGSGGCGNKVPNYLVLVFICMHLNEYIFGRNVQSSLPRKKQNKKKTRKKKRENASSLKHRKSENYIAKLHHMRWSYNARSHTQTYNLIPVYHTDSLFHDGEDMQ